ncbi:electron transport complex subunit RsxG [Parasulfuritortus cantonensis]|uniref:Ion-translocating oxidoreductase complex subunit G n=1 Tax=Parasulfuritortus cantonensis TaxID=2528202 RepID=A0A4R1BKS0_9PROT|nr:electron transport complex subunit RsxG [Parasulfuritortus cantonensis]TCJ18025.1 electron transport complex subunit RsxG [Parasulfuritortus cantonensis]
MKEFRNQILTTAAALLVFSGVGAALLSGTFKITRPAIEQSERSAKMKLVAQTLPAGGFDNDPVKDARPLPADALLGLKFPGQAYLASRHGAAVAVVLEAAAPDGYSGEIRFLVGILPDGRVSGVRVTGHRETPGLGDYIEIGKSPWIRNFDGKSLSNPQPLYWKVRKDGGQFDYMAGATITPRAMVKAVRKALEYFAAHRDELLAPPAPGPAGPSPETTP